MLLFLKFLIYTVLITYFLAFGEPTAQTLRAGSKYAFIQAPYINIIQKHKEMTAQEEPIIQWPNGIVKYHIDNQSYDAIADINIRWAMDYIEKTSCIKFLEMLVKPSDNITWLHITNPNKERECTHEVTHIDGAEVIVVLGYDCMMRKGILHTLLHGVGMKDEVTHPHRDKYIRVLWDNIRPAYHHLYRKRVAETSVNQVEYDPLSIMQFHDRAFSRNGRATILPLEPGLVLSPSENMSQLDQMKLQIYFGHECNKRKISSILDTCKMSLRDKKDNVPEKTFSDKEDNSSLVQPGSVEYENETLNLEKLNVDELKSNETKEMQIGIAIEENVTNGKEAEGTYEEEHIEDAKKKTYINEEEKANYTNANDPDIDQSRDVKLASVKKQLNDDDYGDSLSENEINQNKNTVFGKE